MKWPWVSRSRLEAAEKLAEYFKDTAKAERENHGLAVETFQVECKGLAQEHKDAVARAARDSEVTLEMARQTCVIVSGERDRLQEQVAKLMDHQTRMDRREHGLAEVPREAKPPMEPMPRDLVDRISSYGNSSMRKQMRDVALRRHAKGESWDAILKDEQKTKSAINS
jgi:hypothetical protein